MVGCANQARLLLVEDDPISREITLDSLEELGLQVDVATNGLEAVKLARDTCYDLILMDVQMPVMDGLKATHNIRQLPQYEHVPILAMTADVYHESFHIAGMDCVLTKPVTAKVLFRIVGDLLHSREQR